MLISNGLFVVTPHPRLRPPRRSSIRRLRRPRFVADYSSNRRRFLLGFSLPWPSRSRGELSDTPMNLVIYLLIPYYLCCYHSKVNFVFLCSCIGHAP